MLNFILNYFFDKKTNTKEKVKVKEVYDLRFVKNNKNDIEGKEKTRLIEKTSLDKYFCDFKGLFEFRNDELRCRRVFLKSRDLHRERQNF